MDSALWFLVGCAVATTVTWFLLARQQVRQRVRQQRERETISPSAQAQPQEAQPQEAQPQEAQPQEAQPQEAQPQRAQPQEAQPKTEPPAPTRYEFRDSRSMNEVADALGAELAVLAAGVEGQAQLLCETMGEPRKVAERAERLWEAVRHVRFFCEKMQSFASVGELAVEPTDMRMLLASLTNEVQDYSGGSLQVDSRVAPSLPAALCHAGALRTAILFLIEAVLELESNAAALSIQAQSDEREEDALGVRIDIEAIPEECDLRTPPSEQRVHFSCLAARNLLRAQGAEFCLDHTHGLNALASVTLPASGVPITPVATPPVARPEAAPATEEPARHAASVEFEPAPRAVEPPPADHRFGGVLIVESNASIRDMLAQELGKTGRNVIACADGIAARSLFQATPERFELLILERDSRRLSGAALARLAKETVPEIRILMIHPGTELHPEHDLDEALVSLRKPFGLMELRDRIADVFGPRVTRGAAGANLAGSPDRTDRDDR